MSPIPGYTEYLFCDWTIICFTVALNQRMSKFGACDVLCKLLGKLVANGSTYIVS